MEQARMAAQAQLGALIAQTRRANRRQTRRGERFIRGLSRAFASELRGIARGVGGTYDATEQEQAALNSALGSYLSGSGQRQAANLGQQLGMIDPNTASFYSGQARAAGSSLAKQGYALGSQALQRTIGEGASEESFARSLPGVAALSAIQSARSFESRMGSKLMDELGQIRAQGPALTQQLFGSLMDQALAGANLHMQGEELALRRRELGLKDEAAGSGRLDETLSGARELVAGALTGPQGLPLPEGSRPHALGLFNQVMAFLESRHPGMPEGRRRILADQVLRTFGMDYERETTGAIRDFGSGLFGNGGLPPGLVGRPDEGSRGGGRPFFSAPTREDFTTGPGVDLWRKVLPFL